MMWQIEIYENGEWKRFGSPTSNYNEAYKGMRNLADCGHKVRLRKVK